MVIWPQKHSYQQQEGDILILLRAHHVTPKITWSTPGISSLSKIMQTENHAENNQDSKLQQSFNRITVNTIAIIITEMCHLLSTVLKSKKVRKPKHV